MDHHVHQAITNGLKERGVDVLTAFEDASSELADVALLARATELGRVLFTQDKDFLTIARVHQSSGVRFTGIIFLKGHCQRHGRPIIGILWNTA
jgi:predicted nuclease of predicted toxin-antitoxin system